MNKLRYVLAGSEEIQGQGTRALDRIKPKGKQHIRPRPTGSEAHRLGKYAV